MRRRPQKICFTPPLLRTTAEILHILESFDKEPLPNDGFVPVAGAVRAPKRPVTSVENVDPVASKNPQQGVRIYSVVWGKSNTRKHKIWEGDGRLETSATTWKLTSDEGAGLGSARAVAEPVLAPGVRIRIGNREVEIVEELKSSEAQTTNTTVYNIPPPFKKPCFNENTNKLYHKSHGSNPTLTFPRPANEHQWSHNVHRSVVRDVVLDTVLSRALRPHQRDGVLFLYECVMGFRKPNYCGSILADSMGLGKTLQCVALIWTLLKQGPYGKAVCRRVLVVTPSSLCANWGKEFTKWLGRERIQTYIVDKCHKTLQYANHPLIPIMIVSYEQFVRNFDTIDNINFDMVICDEGHRLKNLSVKAAQLVRRLQTQRRILLTGTPVQNDLQEYFALIDVVNPGILGTYAQFRNNYEVPIVAAQQPNCKENEKLLAQEKSEDLNRLTSKFVLRRTEEVIENYLPQKVELIICCHLSRVQRDLYEGVITQWFNSEIKAPFSAIATLRKICNHPALIGQPNKEPYDVTKLSGKVSVIDSILKNIVIDQKESVVLVSYSTKFLDILEIMLGQRQLNFLRLDGSTPTAQRKVLVESFNAHAAKIFLVSARAGGTGLNLTGASRLLLADGDWNPSNDLQALARIWRDGQKKNVTIYRLLSTGTIEEKIFQRQLSKLALSDSVDDPDSVKSTLKFSEEELKDLFTPNFRTDSITHDVLQCCCQRDPDRTAEEWEASKTCKQELNQLKDWDHIRPPFPDNFLQDIGLKDNDVATFIFRKITNQNHSI